jgi:acyl-CoA reductase-like NAD-dependent aldehyde dehydrogenase
MILSCFLFCLGNAVVLKPSEISENTAKILAKLLPQYLDQVSISTHLVHVIAGWGSVCNFLSQQSTQ